MYSCRHATFVALCRPDDPHCITSIPSVERQKALTTGHLHTQLDPFASNLTICFHGWLLQTLMYFKEQIKEGNMSFTKVEGTWFCGVFWLELQTDAVLFNLMLFKIAPDQCSETLLVPSSCYQTTFPVFMSSPSHWLDIRAANNHISKPMSELDAHVHDLCVFYVVPSALLSLYGDTIIKQCQ